MMPRLARCRPRRAFATVIVLWVIGMAALILVSLQSVAWRDAAEARRAVAEVRARWAARAGVEATIARLEAATLDPDLSNAFALQADLASVAEGSILGSTYLIGHSTPTHAFVLGPMDEHARINVNLMTADALMLIPDFSEDIIDAILDWIDGDDDTRLLGAEAGFYATLRNPYPPRNGHIRTMQELELIAGIRPEFVRGEDWNLNGILDPEEDDGHATWPPDNADGKLDAGWSEILTASSSDGVLLGASGDVRLDLVTATADEIARRLGVTAEQAEAISQHAQGESGTMGDFIRFDLTTLQRRAGGGAGGGAQGRRGFGMFGGQPQPRVEPLTDEQLALLFHETTMDEPEAGPFPGKLNINTCAAEVLQYLPGMEPGLADSIIYERAARSNGFSSIVDLLAVPAMTRDRLAGLVGLIDVRSNVYRITSRGRDSATGVEVEIIATVDRSTVPVVIKDLVIR